jgi:DNA repair exonuclease SbcCD ATPase subunit
VASKPAEKAPGWFTRILMPELVEIKGELKNVNTRIDGLDSKIDSKVESLTNELRADIGRVESKVEGLDERLSSKMDSLRNELKSDIQDLDKRLDIVQRLTIVEAKLRENESKAH